MRPEFRNVDLEVITRVDPAPLARALGKKCSVLYCGRRGRLDFLATFEVHAVHASLERRLTSFCDVLESLPPPAARIWKNSRSRTFDLGLASGDTRPALALGISHRTLTRIADLGATLAITVYPKDR